MAANSLPEAEIYKDNDQYLFCISGKVTLFTIPTIAEVLGVCKPGSKKPPTIFLIFRRPVQKCLVTLNFHYERKAISRLSSTLWKKTKTNDVILADIFVKLYNAVAKQWRKERLIIEFFTPLTPLESTKPPGGDRGGKKKNQELEQHSEDHEITILGGTLKEDDDLAKNENKFICKLSKIMAKIKKFLRGCNWINIGFRSWRREQKPSHLFAQYLKPNKKYIALKDFLTYQAKELKQISIAPNLTMRVYSEYTPEIITIPARETP
ncbi:hypothetical protein C1646_660782 [Rhizophagus diaphanus]|nr:hypothetical protein C1646_660782 [Rhizophagus diaphanus] [Rhizophagus sp. MUCL 43196]